MVFANYLFMKFNPQNLAVTSKN